MALEKREFRAVFGSVRDHLVTTAAKSNDVKNNTKTANPYNMESYTVAPR